jgi:ABC-type sulfate transport system permease component
VVLLFVLVLFPLLRMLTYLGSGDIGKVISSPRFQRALVNSLAVAHGDGAFYRGRACARV